MCLRVCSLDASPHVDRINLTASPMAGSKRSIAALWVDIS